MKLYSLRRLSDDKFFVGTDGRGHLIMNRSPVFWKTPGSIWTNLKRVCSQYVPYTDRWGFQQKDWSGFDPVKLAQWEVIITDVCVLGEGRVPAAEFVDKNALQDLDARTRKMVRAA